MDIPGGVKVKEKDMNIHLLCIIKNIYGQVQAGKLCHEYLVNKLQDIGDKQYKLKNV